MADRADSRPSAADLRDAAEGMVQTLHRAANAIGWETGGLAAADAKRIRTLAALWPAYEAVVAAAEGLADADITVDENAGDAYLAAAVKRLRAARGASTRETQES